MTVGYVFKSSGYPVAAVNKTSIYLPNFGESQNPPKDYEFNFTAGSERYDVKISTRTTSLLYQGDDWNVVIMERFCDAVVNGQKALCLAELHYRYVTSHGMHRRRICTRDENENVTDWIGPHHLTASRASHSGVVSIGFARFLSLHLFCLLSTLVWLRFFER
jgi:hypothetical protein